MSSGWDGCINSQSWKLEPSFFVGSSFFFQNNCMKLEFIHNFSFDIDNGSKAVLKKQNPKKKKKKKTSLWRWIEKYTSQDELKIKKLKCNTVVILNSNIWMRYDLCI